jgi:folate-binding protein YgfZ
MDAHEMMNLLASGSAFVDLSDWRKVAVAGADARAWLNDLVSADVSGVAAGQARPSLLLSPTGGIRAAFTVAPLSDGFVLLQDPRQPSSVQTLLTPYVLSSDVTLEDRSDALAVFAFPGRVSTPAAPGTYSVPSCTGAGGDLLAPVEDLEAVRRSLSGDFTEAPPEALEGWRVAAGIPRLGVDALPEDLPFEGGMGEAVALDKGCYLGQEAVAKVRNLGHPRRLVLHLCAEGEVSPGEVVESDGRPVGEVTSAWADGGRSLLLARVRWEGRDAALHTAAGVALLPAPSR